MTPIIVSALSTLESFPFFTATDLRLHLILFHIIAMENHRTLQCIVEGELNWHCKLRKPKSPLSLFIKLDRLANRDMGH